MKKFLLVILCLCVICSAYGTSYAAEGMEKTIIGSIGNVTFDATVSGNNITQAAIYKVVVMHSDSKLDSTVIDLLNQILFREDLQLDIYEERTDDTGRVTERLYYTKAAKEKEVANYFFYDGAIGANTFESIYYYGIMDIMALMQYSGSCYIPDRLECGDLPMKTADETVKALYDVAERLNLNIQTSPYIVRAYTMDDKLAATPGIQPYLQVVIQGNDLTAENRENVRKYGSNCYFIAYRFEFDGIPVSYSYHYIESKDYSTLPSYVQALYNDNGMIRFFAYNQFEIEETSEYMALISADEAAKYVAEYLNPILGVEAFVCKEISLEYVPLAYSGCNLEREACLVPVWVFYFDGFDVTPIIVNAFDGQIIN